jgi:serine/threonine protein phosphatase PrpC
LIVADGMGGHSGGKAASTCVLVGGKIEWKESEELTKINPNIILRNIFKFSHGCMRDKEKKENTSPKSTCVVLLIKENTAYYAHIGDSRLYHFRNGQLFNKTKDHSVVQMLADMEQIQEEEMATHEDQGRLLKWIGGEKEPDPTFAEVEIMAGDQFLLCSDGLWEYVKEKQILNVLNKTYDLKKATALLIKWAKESGGDKGDNISVALVTIHTSKTSKLAVFLLILIGILSLVISFLLGTSFSNTAANKEENSPTNISEKIINNTRSVIKSIGK